MAGYIRINGQHIPWSFVMMVRKAAAGCWNRTIDAFWKARDKECVIRYVAKGLLRDEKGVRYSLVPSKEAESGQMDKVRSWWYTTYERKNKMASTKDVMKQMLQELVKGD